MRLIEQGTIQNGNIVLKDPLDLPDGTAVVIEIEAITAEHPVSDSKSDSEFISLPFFGMWADREDMNDSAAWVRKEREQWQLRADRRD
ncbi:MAG: hypothetical protein IT210_16130 [Armatimonadetes bacterium]|nr:hypothetical protein [Armatimonadota bacterium]